jgi:hypothetical protein
MSRISLRRAGRRVAVPVAAVAVAGHSHGSGSMACSAVGYSREVTTRLTEPLGARVVVGVVSRAAVPVTSGHSPS